MYQIEQKYLGFGAILGEYWGRLRRRVLGSHLSRCQEGNGDSANVGIRTACKIPAESEAHQPMRFNKECPPATLSDLAGVVARFEKFASTGTIFSQGDIAETVMYIQRGRVKLSVASQTDKEAVVAILGPGDFFGEGSLAGQHTRMVTATAIASTALQVIERNELIRALHAEPALSDRFLSHMLSRNIRIEEDLIDQICQCSERRLARALLLLAGKGNQRKLHRFAGISQATLATMIGTTRPRVNVFMNKFRMLGFIKYHGPLDRNGGIHINTSRLAKALCSSFQLSRAAHGSKTVCETSRDVR
jgi:CRP/FNR family transcriptional regulator, cyclic AMP receptor protein